MSLFAEVTQAATDPILGVTLAWRADPSPDKLNLGVGAYRMPPPPMWMQWA